MSTVQTSEVELFSLEETLVFAEALGQRLRGGEVIELVSDLGGGKTTFVKGLAKGMGSKDAVHSPSFTLGNEYTAGDLRLYHFDFYRLQDPGILREELAEAVSDPQAVVAVEWPGIIEDVLPAERVSIAIAAISETGRRLTITYAEKYNYLFSNT